MFGSTTVSSPIEDYGLIGDGQTIALVNRDGSVDWLCWPRFDSDACLAALLGNKEHGCWSFSAKAKVIGRSRRYEEDTLVLQTDAETKGGAYRITDFMPIRRGDLSSLVRIVEGLSGSVELDMVLKLKDVLRRLLVDVVSHPLHGLPCNRRDSRCNTIANDTAEQLVDVGGGGMHDPVRDGLG